eukprot:TRINITY_DN11308_c0_g2_i2.p1 TRINITY_DN11308_c0_g2~~TRINITY_DN11308_c0_g2_i2.p1  ORF type:complete len:309 (+),score=42.91 TRINITY_DN11308_c0_g2_i2:361-1287(+)
MYSRKMKEKMESDLDRWGGLILVWTIACIAISFYYHYWIVQSLLHPQAIEELRAHPLAWMYACIIYGVLIVIQLAVTVYTLITVNYDCIISNCATFWIISTTIAYELINMVLFEEKYQACRLESYLQVQNLFWIFLGDIFKSRDELTTSTVNRIRECLNTNLFLNTIMPLIVLFLFKRTIVEWRQFFTGELENKPENRESRGPSFNGDHGISDHSVASGGMEVKAEPKPVFHINQNLLLILFIMIETYILINRSSSVVTNAIYLIIGTLFYYLKIRVADEIYLQRRRYQLTLCIYYLFSVVDEHEVIY